MSKKYNRSKAHNEWKKDLAQDLVKAEDFEKWKEEVLCKLKSEDYMSLLEDLRLTYDYLEKLMMESILNENFEIADKIKKCFNWSNHDFNPFNDVRFNNKFDEIFKENVLI